MLTRLAVKSFILTFAYPIMVSPCDFLVQSIRNALSNNTNNRCTDSNIPEPIFPCSICNYDVKHNHKAIFCTSCDQWVHIKCNNISVDEYKKLQLHNSDNPESESDPWFCMKCVLLERSDFIPFIFCSANELNNIDSLDSLKLVDLLPNEVVTNEVERINQLSINDDIDENSVENIDCKYYTCDQFFNLDNTFNILHSNVNGYISKADNVNEFLSTEKSQTDFDVICFSETSLNNDVIPENAKPCGFGEPFATNTLSSRGGVAIFTKSTNATERTDLKIQNKEFEGVWVEINNTRTKNTIVGCLYRHPHYNNIESFLDYIGNCLIQLNKEAPPQQRGTSFHDISRQA